MGDLKSAHGQRRDRLTMAYETIIGRNVAASRTTTYEFAASYDVIYVPAGPPVVVNVQLDYEPAAAGYPCGDIPGETARGAAGSGTASEKLVSAL